MTRKEYEKIEEILNRARYNFNAYFTSEREAYFVDKSILESLIEIAKCINEQEK